MPTITYNGPSSKADISTEYHVRDEKGKMVVLRLGKPTEVPDALAKELLGGDARHKGHKFERSEDEAAASAGHAPPEDPSEDPPAQRTAPSTSGRGR